MTLHVQNDSGQTVTTTSETAIATCVTPGFMPCLIRGEVNITTGTGVTAVVFRVRAGINTTTGTIVGVARTDTIAAGASGSFPINEYDPSGVTTGYTLTVQQTGATGNGTVNAVSLDVENQ